MTGQRRTCCSHSVVYLSGNVRLRLTDEHDKAMADLIDERAAYGVRLGRLEKLLRLRTKVL